jgi:hypothetical protein
MTWPFDCDRASPQGHRRDPASIAHPAWCHLDQHLPEFGPSCRTREQRPFFNQRAVLGGTNDEINLCRPAGKAAVDVALAVANDHHRRRIRHQFSGSLDPSQPAAALLVFNRTVSARRRFDLVVAGPDMRVQKTKNSLRLAIDGDQGMDEKPCRNPITGGSKPATIDLPTGEIDLGGVLRDDNPPPRGCREGAPRQGSQHLPAGHRRRR